MGSNMGARLATCPLNTGERELLRWKVREGEVGGKVKIKCKSSSGFPLQNYFIFVLTSTPFFISINIFVFLYVFYFMSIFFSLLISKATNFGNRFFWSSFTLLAFLLTPGFPMVDRPQSN